MAGVLTNVYRRPLPEEVRFLARSDPKKALERLVAEPNGPHSIKALLDSFGAEEIAAMRATPPFQELITFLEGVIKPSIETRDRLTRKGWGFVVADHPASIDTRRDAVHRRLDQVGFRVLPDAEHSRDHPEDHCQRLNGPTVAATDLSEFKSLVVQTVKTLTVPPLAARERVTVARSAALPVSSDGQCGLANWARN